MKKVTFILAFFASSLLCSSSFANFYGQKIEQNFKRETVEKELNSIVKMVEEVNFSQNNFENSSNTIDSPKALIADCCIQCSVTVDAIFIEFTMTWCCVRECEQNQ